MSPGPDQNFSNEFTQSTRGMRQYARLWMAAWLLLADACGLFLAGLLAVGLRYLIGNLINPPFYWNLLFLIPIFLAVYSLRLLYPAVGLSPVEELHRLSVSTSIVFLFFTAFTFWVRGAEYFSRLVIAFSWGFALLSVPLCRWIFRVLVVNLGWWGEPLAVVGGGPHTVQIVDFLLRRARFGLRPVVILNGASGITNSPIPAISLASALEHPDQLSSLQTAVLIEDELPAEFRQAVLSEQRLAFRRLILISNLNWIGSLGVTPYDLEGLLGLEIRQNLLEAPQQALKRLLDLLLASTVGLLTLPLTLLIAAWVRLDSPGPALYAHRRLGKNGLPITIWKFRTMLQDANIQLERHLASDPVAAQEWQESMKLKQDPRITRAGRLLRRASLDELPQLWNILRGEMSLVGPRPIVDQEIPFYEAGYSLYCRVHPGLTGLWQVSGRGDASYSERVRYDEYYVRNWSLWLDLYILLRTVWVVLRGEGAY